MLPRFCAVLCSAAVAAATFPSVAASVSTEGLERNRAVEADVHAESGTEGSVCLLQREHGQRQHAQAGAAVALSDDVVGGSGRATAVAESSAAVSIQASTVVGNEFARAEVAAAREAAHDAASHIKGVSEAMGLDYAAQSMSMTQAQSERRSTGKVVTADPPVSHPRNKMVLMVINAFPICWMFGIDRMYLGSITTGIVKFCLSTCTFGVVGVIWGLIDFVAVLINAWQKDTAISTLGLHATFSAEDVNRAHYMVFVDILMIPIWIWFYFFSQRKLKAMRMAKLQANAMKSPDYGKDPSQLLQAGSVQHAGAATS